PHPDLHAFPTRRSSDLFLSAKLVTEAAQAVFEDAEPTLEPYAEALTRALAPLVSAGWGAKVALDRFPRLAFSIARLRPMWPVVEDRKSTRLNSSHSQIS